MNSGCGIWFVGKEGVTIGGGFGITGLKAALDLLGFAGGLPRPPLRPASKQIVETIRGQLDALGVLPVRV